MKRTISDKRIFIFLIAGAFACFALSFWNTVISPGESIEYVEKNPAGEDGRNVDLKAVIEGDDTLSLAIDVPAVQYTEAEAEAFFAEAAAAADEIFKGEGNEYAPVSHDISLPSSFPDNPVSIEWQSSAPAVLSSAGKIGTPDKDGENVSLTAAMTLGEHEDRYIFELRVFPDTESEGTAGILKSEAERLNEGSTDDKYILPREVSGKEVTWYEVPQNRFGTLAVILLLAALILKVRERKREEEKEKKRNEQLKKEYPELISRILLLCCAGLGIRKIMYRMAAGSPAAGNSGREKQCGPALEEIKKVCSDLDNGIGETEAFERFGRRCSGAGYRTLAVLLSRSTVRGGAGMLKSLEQEAYQSFEDAKRRARAAGEVAAVKLLLPMALMLAVVMIIVLVPSFLSFMMN